jgi:hypothetical protein
LKWVCARAESCSHWPSWREQLPIGAGTAKAADFCGLGWPVPAVPAVPAILRDTGDGATQLRNHGGVKLLLAPISARLECVAGVFQQVVPQNFVTA